MVIFTRKILLVDLTSECSNSRKMYEEFVFREVEIQDFARTTIRFQLNGMDEVGEDSGEIGVFWDVI